ncbi:MAG: HRDC domain-containing protein [Sedimentisphaerales bacterium]|nr:HRDC domain-containing protein [Sedimentisphaerales bacterium]
MTDSQQEPYIYINSQPELGSLISAIKKADKVAIDIEADSLHHYYEKVCLIQITIDKINYIVDPLARIDLSEFLDALSKSHIVLHDGGYDLRMMRHSFDFVPKSKVFDTMLAAKLLGFRHFSLGAMVKEFFGIELKKTGQKADWSARPLSSSLLKYASDDTHFLLELADKLSQKLKELDRISWHKQICKKMVASAAMPTPQKDEEDQWRIKGASLLTRSQLVYVKELFNWRQEQAQKADRPSFKIMTNHLLLELAEWAQTNPKKPLKGGPKLPRDCKTGRLKALEAAIKKAHNTPSSDWPMRRKPTPRKQLAPNCKLLIQALREDAAEVAEKLKIDPSVLATRSALISIAYGRPKTVNEIIKSGPLMKWQAEILEPVIAKNLKKFKAPSEDQ